MSNRQTPSRAKSAGKQTRSDRTCLLVLGMHRSGTSALTRVLSLLGADLPATLMGGSEANLASNAKGHWESEPLVRLNDEIFKSAGIQWRTPEAMPGQWYESVRLQEFKDRAQALIQSEFDRSPLFVFKDPRVCKLVPFWLSVLEQLQVRPAIVNMIRSPEEVAESLLNRNALDRPLGMLMWLRYVLGAERDTRNNQRVHLSYDGLLADWRESAESISTEFDIAWPADSVERTELISQFLSTSEKHHRRTRGTSARDALSSWTDEAYTILDEWAAGGERASDYGRLDSIAVAFDHAVQPLLAPLLVSYEKSTSVQKLQTLRSTHTAEIDELHRQIGSISGMIVNLANELELPLTEHESDASADVVDAALAQLGNFAAALKAERDASSRELAEHRQASSLELADLRHRQVELEVQISRLLDDVDSKNAELTRKERELLDATERMGEIATRLKNEMAELAARHEQEKQAAASRETRLHDLFNVEREQRLNFEKSLVQAQRINAALLIVRGRYEAASEELARVRAEREDARKRSEDLHKQADEIQAQLEEAQRRSKADREKLRVEREKLQSALAAVRDNRAARLAERDSRIKELKHSVKRLESELEKQREIRRELELRPQAPAAAGISNSVFRRLVPGAERRRLNRSMELVKSSGLFDPAYYLEQNADLSGEPHQLLEHFILHGGFEGRTPSGAFDSRKYLDRYPDVAAAGLNPLLHFLESGRAEGRVAIAVTDRHAAQGSQTEAQSAAADRSEETSDVGRRENAVAAEGDSGAGEASVSTETAPEIVETGLAQKAHSFSALAIDASDWAKSAELPDFESRRVGDIKVAVESSSKPESKAALLWFEALRDRSTPDGVQDPALAVRSTLHEGNLRIEDVWLSSDFSLRIRVSRLSTESLVIRCCQRSDEGAVILCSERLLPTGQSAVVETRLVSRFTPLLLVITDRAGLLIDSTLVPFPTLVRGGLHHAELIDSSSAAIGWAAHGDYVSELLTAVVDNARDFAVSEVLIDLGAANGTEAIFSEDFRRWIAWQFKVALEPQRVPDRGNPALAILAERLQSAVPGIAGRTSGRKLFIGSKSIPTIAILLAREAELIELTRVRTIVADELTRGPLHAVDYPAIAFVSRMGPQPAFEPPLKPGASESTKAAVASIAFNSGDIHDIRAAFPIAGDAVVALGHIVDGEETPVSAIIHCSGNVEILAGLLASLGQQQCVSNVECLLIGDVPDVPDSAIMPFGPARPMSLIRTGIEGPLTGFSLRAAMERATHDLVISVDDRKVLHDPRTVRILGSLCARKEIGTVGCSLVTENAKKNSVPQYTRRSGYLLLNNSRTPPVTTRADPDGLELPAVYPVLANPIGCLMTRREIWRVVGDALDAVELADEAFAVRAGQAIIEKAKLNVATSLISIFDRDEPSSVNVEVPLVAGMQKAFVTVEEY